MLKTMLTKIAVVAITITVISCIKKKNDAMGQKMASANPLEGLKYTNLDSENIFENPKEVELDGKIIQLVNRYKIIDESEREKIRQSLSQDDIYTIVNFCERATVFGLRQQNKNIEYGLSALSMVDPDRCDVRDALVSIAFVHHGIENLKLDSAKLYEEAIQLSNPRMKELFRSFQGREPQNKTIEVVAGYTEYQFDEGIGFINCGYEKYSPTRDLPKIALKIGRYIKSDKYHSGGVSIAEDLPLNWIGGDNNEKIKSELEKTLGTALFRSNVREEFTKDGMWQILLLHLVEFKSEKEAIGFREAIGKEHAEKFARIFGSVNNIFYVLVESSTITGVKDFETYESLKRFRGPIEKIIKEETSH